MQYNARGPRPSPFSSFEHFNHANVVGATQIGAKCAFVIDLQGIGYARRLIMTANDNSLTAQLVQPRTPRGIAQAKRE